METMTLPKNATPNFLITPSCHTQWTIPSLRAYIFQIDNDTGKGFFTSTIRKKRSKSWDCKYHWMKEKNKDDFLEFIGIEGTTTRVITSQNITLQPITNTYNQPMSLTLQNNCALQHNHSCEGVFLPSCLASSRIRRVSRDWPRSHNMYVCQTTLPICQIFPHMYNSYILYL